MDPTELSFDESVAILAKCQRARCNYLQFPPAERRLTRAELRAESILIDPDALIGVVANRRELHAADCAGFAYFLERMFLKPDEVLQFVRLQRTLAGRQAR